MVTKMQKYKTTQQITLPLVGREGNPLVVAVGTEVIVFDNAAWLRRNKEEGNQYQKIDIPASFVGSNRTLFECTN